MKRARVIVLAILGFCWAGALAAAQGIPPAVSPATCVERLVLIDGKAVDGWEAVDSTVSSVQLEGASALLFAVKVDWSSGEGSNPIGRPRIQMTMPPERGDWREWEQLRLKVYALTERDPLPRRALGVGIRTGDRRGSRDRPVEGLQTGRWQEFSFDLADVPERERVRSVSISISEDAYRDGEGLRFYISDLELVRYTQPMLSDLKVLASVAFADAEALPLSLKMLGLKVGETAPVELRLNAGDKVLASMTALASEGATQVSLPMPRGIRPGEYTVVASCKAGAPACPHGQPRSQAVRLISTPWEGKAQ